MKEDPLVDEIHRIRSAIAGRFANDLAAICEDARKRQARSGRQTVALPPKVPRHPTPTKRKVG